MPHQNEPNGAQSSARAEITDSEKLLRYLQIVKNNGRDLPVRVWGAQVRYALSNGLVKVGWGGVVELTDLGRNFVKGTRA